MINGYMGLGRLADGAFIEYSGYTRPGFFVSLGQPAIGHVAWIKGPTAPVHATVSHGALYATETTDRAHLVWQWGPPAIVIPAPGGYQAAEFPPVDVSIVWEHAVLHALNASLQPGYRSDIVTVERGATVGTINGMPLLALLRLAVVAGDLVSRASIPRNNPQKAA